MNNIQKKTYIDKDETDSMEKKQMKKKQIVCTYNNMTSKDYKQYTILSMIILLPIVRIKMNENAFSTIYKDEFTSSNFTSYNINITRFVGIASV